MGKRFVDVPTDRLQAEIEDIGKSMRAIGAVAAWKISGREKVFYMTTPSKRLLLKIYTSIRIDGTVRGCGHDAIRIVVGRLTQPGFFDTFRPTRASKRIFRTAPNCDNRVDVFLKRFRDEIRASYKGMISEG